MLQAACMNTLLVILRVYDMCDGNLGSVSAALFSVPAKAGMPTAGAGPASLLTSPEPAFLKHARTGTLCHTLCFAGNWSKPQQVMLDSRARMSK